MVSDLPALVIRGFSAAIVVFLAAEGGLAIFSGSGTVDPNPYILMFTCFAAAVFSEDAWARVRKKLDEGKENGPTRSIGDKDSKAADVNKNTSVSGAEKTSDTKSDAKNTGEGTGQEKEAPEPPEESRQT